LLTVVALGTGKVDQDAGVADGAAAGQEFDFWIAGHTANETVDAGAE
jgi:hypothetical protein